MRRNKKSIILYLFVLCIIAYNEYTSLTLHKYQLPSKALLHLDRKPIDMYMQRLQTDKDFNIYWGFAKEKQKIILPKKDANTTKRVRTIKKTGKNILCIDSSCYRLVGIHDGKVTLYNKKLKYKMKDYSVNDILNSAVIIKNIQTHTVLLQEINTTKSYVFKLFDINQTKYKPKEMQNDKE